MKKSESETRPQDPRDKGGRNESGQNPDTQIEMGRHMQNESPAELQKQFKEIPVEKSGAKDRNTQ